ncbi:hypothetical protein HYC85_023376 [Camellia sinensis]|uniref:MHD domain-containing protein n=1 Tax=Camellia sinensis TaxID=4442 RepID=A0A7J7GF29_CAMSI|nr:hypothetical protein HYC85_023376 [Camellia sinensis]
MVDGLVTEGSPSPKGSSHIVKDLLLERDLLTLMDIVKRNGGKNQSSASEIVLGMSPRASIGVQSEVPTPSSFVEVMGGLCSEIRDLAQQQKLCFGGEVVSSLAVCSFAADATNPNIRTSLGFASYAPEKDALIWEIKSFPGGKEYMLRVEYTLPSITSEDAASERKAPIRVKFEIPYFAVSGIQVRYLKIIEKSGYQALPRARYITMASEYELRLMYASFGPEYAYPQGVYNPHMGQHYLQIYGVPGTVNTNIVPYGQMGHPFSGNHGYPTIQGYVTPGRHVLQYGGPLVSGVTTDTIVITQAQYLAVIKWFEMQMKAYRSLSFTAGKSGFGSLLSLGHSRGKTYRIHMKGPGGRGEVEVAVSRVLLVCWSCWFAAIAALMANACWAAAVAMLL